MTDQKAIVVGGGIAGLAAAAALIRTGWRVQVLESAPELGEVGAGLAVTVNGARALDAIGAGDRVRRDGYAVRPAGSRRSDGKWLLRAPDGNGLTRMIGIHRQRLHAALAESAAGAELVTGARVTAVDPGTPGASSARVTWTSASGSCSADADLVVGADGIRSVTRGVLFSPFCLALQRLLELAGDHLRNHDRRRQLRHAVGPAGRVRLAPDQCRPGLLVRVRAASGRSWFPGRDPGGSRVLRRVGSRRTGADRGNLRRDPA
ncbi:hypothetical protein E0H73_09615 [Kribbella pittospori]|uniref:FAD-binding domain-containing protein n=1 Tax=Kribbella pittospori TaxID=722689 RepID=A0A4R0L762_9ACTN|nr:hypothetical protein E0H73_09615 [Kribbella pittospori]